MSILKNRAIKRRRTPLSCVIYGDFDTDFYFFDSRNDLGLLIESLAIPMPSVKTDISSPYGMDGSLDASDVVSANGTRRTFYESRKIKIVFGVEDREKYYYALENYNLKSLLHGHVREITFADDPDYFWRGRMTVASWDPYAIIPHITVEMNAHPFKESHNSFDSGEKAEVPFLGVLQSQLSLDTDKTTATTCSITNGHFSVRGPSGSVAVWRADIPYAGRFVLRMERGSTDTRYGGRWELRDANYNVISPFGLENADGETLTIYIVFYSDYEVTYTWLLPDLIDCSPDDENVFKIDVGQEPVYPVIACSHENCVMVDLTQEQIVELAQGSEQNFDILLEPGEHEICFCCLRVSANEVYTFRLWVQRGYL